MNNRLPPILWEEQSDAGKPESGRPKSTQTYRQTESTELMDIPEHLQTNITLTSAADNTTCCCCVLCHIQNVFIMRAGCSFILVQKILIYMHIGGPENATFLSNSWYFSLTQLSWLLHLLNILGQDNAIFLGDSCYYILLQL